VVDITTSRPKFTGSPLTLGRTPHAAFMTLRQSHVSPTCRTDAGSGPPPPNSLTFRPVVGQLSEVVPFLLLEQRRGMACPATLYVDLVTVGVQEQAEDILVPPLLRNCLTLMTFRFPGHYLPSRTVVLAIVFTV